MAVDIKPSYLWKIYIEFGSCSLAACDLYHSIVAFNYTFDDRHSKSRTVGSPGGFLPLKGIKNLVRLLKGQADSVVAHGQDMEIRILLITDMDLL